MIPSRDIEKGMILEKEKLKRAPICLGSKILAAERRSFRGFIKNEVAISQWTARSHNQYNGRR